MPQKMIKWYNQKDLRAELPATSLSIGSWYKKKLAKKLEKKTKDHKKKESLMVFDQICIKNTSTNMSTHTYTDAYTLIYICVCVSTALGKFYFLIQ